MRCNHCYQEREDHLSVCPHCGTPASPASNPEPLKHSSYEMLHHEYVPDEKMKKPSLGFLIAIACVIGLMIAILFVFSMKSPQYKIYQALSHSIEEFHKISDTLGFSTLSEIRNSQAVRTKTELSISDVQIPLASFFKKFKFSFEAGLDQKNKKMDFSPKIRFGNASLVDFTFTADQNILALDFFKRPNMLAVDTKNITPLLTNENFISPEIVNDNFDLFQYTQASFHSLKNTDWITLFMKHFKKVLPSLEITEVPYTESPLSPTQYHIVIPNALYHQLLDDIKNDIQQNILNSLNDLAPDWQKDILFQLDNYFSNLKNKITNGLAFNLFVQNQFIVQFAWSDNQNSSISLQIGGEHHYMDTIMLKFQTEDSTLIIDSKGNHFARGNEFNDISTISFSSPYGNFSFTSHFTYQTDSNQFTWFVQDQQTETQPFIVKGTLHTNFHFYELKVSELRIFDNQIPILTLQFSYTLQPYSKPNVQQKPKLLLNNLNREEFQALWAELSKDFELWRNKTTAIIFSEIFSNNFFVST